jgi:hypothetical protein
MPTYVMLTRLTSETVKSPAELKRLEKAVTDHVRKDCPQVKWVANTPSSASTTISISSRRPTRSPPPEWS